MVYIWVRTTGNWNDEQAFRAQLPANLKPKVELWDATFNIPYRAFRQRVRQIAQLNLARVEQAVCAAWDEIPDGALVLPVDDDDWFAPDAGRVLEDALEPGIAGFYWAGSWVELPIHLGHRIHLIRRRLMPWTRPTWICATNSYAMIKSPDVKDLLDSHVRASRWFEREVAQGDASKVTRVERRLSVTNRSLASRSSLRASRGSDNAPVSRAHLLRRLRRYQRLYKQPVPPDVAWCRPYVSLMGELVQELRARS